MNFIAGLFEPRNQLFVVNGYMPAAVDDEYRGFGGHFRLSFFLSLYSVLLGGFYQVEKDEKERGICSWAQRGIYESCPALNQHTSVNFM